MEIQLFNKYKIKMPDTFTEMEEEAIKEKFNGPKIDLAYVDETGVTIAFLMTDRDLEKQDVKNRILEYQQAYARMVPGFQLGEVALRRQLHFQTGILTYKSNAAVADKFNILALTNCDGKELLMLCSCDMKESASRFGEFCHIIDSMSLI